MSYIHSGEGGGEESFKKFLTASMRQALFSMFEAKNEDSSFSHGICKQADMCSPLISWQAAQVAAIFGRELFSTVSKAFLFKKNKKEGKTLLRF